MVAQLLSWSTSSVFVLLFNRHLQYHAVFTAARFFSSQFQSCFLGIFVETLTLSPILWPQYVSVTLMSVSITPFTTKFFQTCKVTTTRVLLLCSGTRSRCNLTPMKPNRFIGLYVPPRMILRIHLSCWLILSRECFQWHS